MYTFHNIKKIIFYKLAFYIILITVLFLPTNALFAQVSGPPTGIPNPLSSGTLVGFLKNVLSAVVIFAIPIAALMIIYSGFLFVTARGSEEQLRKAKKTFLYTIIGTTILLGAQVIISVVSETIKGL